MERKPLSSAAQTVLAAVNDVRMDADMWPEDMPQVAAAAIRAAANSMAGSVDVENDGAAEVLNDLILLAKELQVLLTYGE